MELETARLLIRSFRVEDQNAYSAIVADKEVMRFLGGVLSSEQALKYIEHAIQSEPSSGIARYAVEQKETGELIGMCGLSPVKDYIDLGYRFAKTSWGLGFATEAASAIVEYGFVDMGFPEIVGLTHPDNHASIKVLEKLGFLYVQDEMTPMGMQAKQYVARNNIE